MYSVRIREHMMIAHSLPHPFFGPASKMHGATYVIDAEFFSEKLDPHGVVLDIGFAHQALKEVLQPLNYQNLDELPDFQGIMTTTEFLAREIHRRLSDRVREVFSGSLRITLHESHVASASFDGLVE